MSVATPSSQFGAILRRSKFASFDPAIAQVYTSHGGHLHRGNWGLKRPLPIRRRDAHITVKAVDSREEQTEWKYGDAEGRFVKMWDEVGFTPSLVSQGPWATKLGALADVDWKLDTEFADASVEDMSHTAVQDPTYGPTSQAVPNIYAMSDKEFKRYLEKLRKSRPAFVSYLGAYPRKQGAAGSQTSAQFSSLWDSSRDPGRDHKMFFGSQAYHTYNSPESRSIEQQPQTYAGLTYGRSSPLQNYLLYKPKPGRILDRTLVSRVSFAGVVVEADFSKTYVDSSVDFKQLAKSGERDPKEGFAMFRVKSFNFGHAPQTVGKVDQASGWTGYQVAVAPMAVEMDRTNTHLPGSPAYVAHSSRKIKADTLLAPRSKPRIPQVVAEEEKQSSEQVLRTLGSILTQKK